jgi:hypothetical protein
VLRSSRRGCGSGGSRRSGDSWLSSSRGKGGRRLKGVTKGQGDGK